MTSLTVLNVLVGIIVVLGVGVTAKTMTIGCVSPDERHLGSKHVYTPAGSFYTVYTVNVTYPTMDDSQPGTVSRIVIKDLGSPEYFAYFSLVNGGPGKKYATIRAKSQRGEKLDFTIEFYGH